MNLRDFTSRPHAVDSRDRFYRAFVGWFKRANLIGSWVNYEQDIELLIKNFSVDLERFESLTRKAAPPGSQSELQEFLSWQLLQYSCFDDEDTRSHQYLDEVLGRIVQLEVEDALAVLRPMGKSDFERLCRDCKKYPHSLGGRRSISR